MVLRGLLKFLGRLALAVLILGVVLGVAGFFMARNIDPNMFRAEIEKVLTQQTAFRVELGDIAFHWKPQPQLQVAGLKLYHPKNLEMILQSDQILIDSDLTSVWHKHFSVSKIIIQNPEIFLKRDPAGLWNWQILKEAAMPAPVAATKSSTGGLIPTAEASERAEGISLNLGQVTQGWEFGIGKIFIKNATVHFADETVQPTFRFEIEKLQAEVHQKDSSSAFRFTAGGSVFHSAKQNLETEGTLDLASQSLDLVLRYGPDKAEFKGHLKGLSTLPHFEGTLEIRDLDMDSVIPEVYKKGEYVSGRLSTKAQIAFDGANPDSLKRSLQGQGTIDIREGALRNRNLIKEVFDRLSPVLAITGALGAELPPEFSEMLASRDTPFDSLQVAFAMQSGIGKIHEFRLIHTNYQLSGQGTYGLGDKRINGSLQLFLSPSISVYLIKKIHEMEMIADRNGRIMIPFRYNGVFPDASVQPDLGYIGSRMLLQGGTDQLLNQGLEQLSKYLERKKK